MSDLLPDLFLVPEFHSTPWIRKPTVPFGRTLFVARILSAEGNTVADIKSVDDGVATAKAACIVAAVNQHAALLADVATLKAQREKLLAAALHLVLMVGASADGDENTLTPQDIVAAREARAAIAATEGEAKP